MSRGLLGGALGAGAATVYLKPEIVQDWAKEVVFGPRSSSVTLGASKELEQLQRLVEDLSRQVAAAGKPGPVTVVHTGGDRGSAYLLYGCTAAGLGAVLYFRVLRGWTFGDMLYATRRGLRDGLAQVSTGLEQLGTRVQEVKARLQERIAALLRKQEELAAAQGEMAAVLAGVGRDVEHTRGQVGQVHAVVMDLEASMAEVGANQRHANHGIYVLCKAVSELMAGSSIPSKAELIEYTQQHPVWAAASERVQGLESLLPGLGGGTAAPPRRLPSTPPRGRDDAASPERRGPFLLPLGRTGSGGSADGGAGGAEGAAPPRKALSDGASLVAGVMTATAFHTVPVTFPSSVSVGGASGSSAVYSSGDW